MAELKIRIEPEDIVDRVVNEVKYKGRTIAEWVDSLVNPKTQADRFRAMSDEELTEYIRVFFPEVCPHGNCPGEDYCYKCWLDWLKSPVEVEDCGAN